MIFRGLSIMLVVGWVSVSLAQAYFPSQYDYAFQTYSAAYLPENEWQLLKAQCYQESLLVPTAVSPVGARGLCQFMPGTWTDVTAKLHISAGPFNPLASIRAAAYYMMTLKRFWFAPRPELDRNKLAMASYNAGAGNIAKAQRICGGANLYDGIIVCLPHVTGKHSDETVTYVERIYRWFGEMR